MNRIYLCTYLLHHFFVLLSVDLVPESYEGILNVKWRMAELDLFLLRQHSDALKKVDQTLKDVEYYRQVNIYIPTLHMHVVKTEGKFVYIHSNAVCFGHTAGTVPYLRYPSDWCQCNTYIGTYFYSDLNTL